MNAKRTEDHSVAAIAAAIGEPARARILLSLMDNRARTATELAVVAGVTPSTASTHLSRLVAGRLIRVHVQGKHRYYRLESPRVARVLEGLSVLAGDAIPAFVPNTPDRLRSARTCYDHIAGSLGVAIKGRFETLGLLQTSRGSIDLTPKGVQLLTALGVDVESTRRLRRHFAVACLDWSERRPHLGGALGAALLNLALHCRWVTQDLDSRALTITTTGRRELRARFGIEL